MPTASIDTFFACSLMTILVLSAMAGLSTTLSPYLTCSFNEGGKERCIQIAKYMLLSSGVPPNWGENGEITPESFGLAEIGEAEAYALDVDKVSRLNSENAYALSYSELRECFGISDVAFKISIKPVFEVQVNMSSKTVAETSTVYTFEITTAKAGLPVPTRVKGYVVAEDYVNSTQSLVSQVGQVTINVSIPNTSSGQAVLVLFARHAFNPQISSFAVYYFQHNSEEPLQENSFLRLSPLNYTLTVSKQVSTANISKAYAFTFNYWRELAEVQNSGESIQYGIPRLLDPSPFVLVVTGRNSTRFFVEYVSYPQIPLEIGADFDSSFTRTNLEVVQQLVVINQAVYEFMVVYGAPGL